MREVPVIGVKANRGAGLITMNFTLTDKDEDSVAVLFEYSLDGVVYNPIDINEGPFVDGYAPSIKATSGGERHVCEWDTWGDLPTDYVGHVCIRVTINDDADTAMLTTINTVLNKTRTWKVVNNLNRGPAQ